MYWFVVSLFNANSTIMSGLKVLNLKPSDKEVLQSVIFRVLDYCYCDFFLNQALKPFTVLLIKTFVCNVSFAFR